MRVDASEIGALVREASRLASAGGSEAERAAYLAWKQDLLARILHACPKTSGEPR